MRGGEWEREEVSEWVLLPQQSIYYPQAQIVMYIASINNLQSIGFRM